MRNGIHQAGCRVTAHFRRRYAFDRYAVRMITTGRCRSRNDDFPDFQLGNLKPESPFNDTTQRYPFSLRLVTRSEEHTSELQSLMRISYAVFCLKKKTRKNNTAIQHK